MPAGVDSGVSADGAVRTLWFIAVAVLFLLVPASDAIAQEPGEEQYLATCAGCHGPAGTGTAWAPSIRDQGAAGADFMMRTGRMPLATHTDPVKRGPRKLTLDQIDAISDYVGQAFDGPPIPTVEPLQGDLGLGAERYLLNCAACHGSTGVGAALVTSRHAPSVLPASALEIAEVIRAGPGPMPAYSEVTLDQHELNSVVAYVLTLSAEPGPGGWSLGRWGPVAEGAVAWLIGLAAVIASATWIEGKSEVGTPAKGEEQA